MSWWWRTKPRSILRTVQWFKFFSELEGQNWNEEDKTKFSKFGNNKIHPVRRNYIYKAHKEEDIYIKTLTFSQYIAGQYDKNETESNGRNDKITFEFFGFGFVNKSGIINVTKVGKRIVEGKFDSEDFLKQLLKLQFPNPVSSNVKGFGKVDQIFPLELLIQAINKFEYLNRSEIALLFGCKNKEMFENAFSAIDMFRDKYNKLPNKNDTAEVKKIFEKTYEKAYGNLENQSGSYYDYAEAFCRCLIYTGIFKSSGRSLATKIRVPEYSRKKFDMLLTQYEFKAPVFEKNIEKYMEWYGDSDSTHLPWENFELRKEIVEEKIDFIKDLKSNNDFVDFYQGNIENIVDEFIKEKEEKIERELSITNLKDVENELTEFIVNLNEEQYIKVYSQTKKARDEILEKYDEILDTIDMGALWLEVNTWKSLLALPGEKIVKRNFAVEEDLTPKSFAPGIGNTPDMELYTGDYIIIPEVSLMSGIQQWEHEASSVIDHVLSFINEFENKKVRGLFISSSLNIRTKWQFFILNKESWIGKPVPVIPMTIEQYKDIMSVFYEKNLDVTIFVELLEKMQLCALNSDNFNLWFDNSKQLVNEWKSGF